MVIVCGIASCRNRSTKENDVMLHRFPADKIRAELWLKVIQSHQPSFNISNQTRICNSHFVETDYTKKKLNKEAIPSIFRPTPRRSLVRIFDLPTDEQIRMISQYTGNESLLSNISSESEIPENDISQYTDDPSFNQPSESYMEHIPSESSSPETNLAVIPETPEVLNICSVVRKKRYMGDFSQEDLNSPTKRRKYWYITQKNSQNYVKKIKNLKKRNQRLLKKVKTMANLIDHLKEENKISGTTILSVSSLAKCSEENYLDLLCANESDEDMIEDDLTEYSIDVLEYISGFIVKKVLSKIKCSICSDAIQDGNRISINLLDIKNRGGLKKPSKDVISLCKIGELVFKIHKDKLPANSPIEFLIIKASSKININNYFTSLNIHILEQSPLNNHLLQLIKMIFKIFFTTRLNYHLKNLSQPQHRIRSHLTKVIHFKNQ